MRMMRLVPLYTQYFPQHDTTFDKDVCNSTVFGKLPDI